MRSHVAAVAASLTEFDWRENSVKMQKLSISRAPRLLRPSFLAHALQLTFLRCSLYLGQHLEYRLTHFRYINLLLPVLSASLTSLLFLLTDGIRKSLSRD